MHFRLVIAVLGLSFLLGLLILAALVIRDSQPTWSYFSGSMQEYFSVDLGSWGETPSATPTSTQTATATATATSTPTPTETATPTPTRRPRKTRRPTETLTQTPTITDTATQTPTPTDTPTATVTPTPSITPPPNCTYSIGYWKEHPESWPLVEISLGEREYTAEQALALLSEPPQEDASLHLVRQLIAARLNIASGADYISMNEIILQSDTWLERYPPGSNPGEPDRQEGLNLATLLDEFNTGVTGPGLCPVVLSFSLPLFNIHNG